MDIRSIVTEIQKSKIKDKESYFKQLYPDFVTKYPTMFQMACTSKIDVANLEFMLDMLEKMNKNEQTQYDASAAVGQMLFDKYVDPKLQNVTTASNML